MKKFSIALAMLAILALPSCKNRNNQNNETETEEVQVSVNAEYIYEDLKLNFDNMLASASKLKAVPFVYSKDGKVELSEKEKMVKPEYLLNSEIANDRVTLTQKYRAIAMFAIDRTIAELYDMDFDNYDAAISRLLAEIDDPALKDFATAIRGHAEFSEAANKFYDAEFHSQRANFFWEAVSAALVEQIYICTKNINKFMTMFDDETASDLTYNFVLVKDGLQQLMKYYPDMENLNKALEPLYVINAISVEQLREQLTELKGEIEVIRNYIIQ